MAKGSHSVTQPVPEGEHQGQRQERSTKAMSHGPHNPVTPLHCDQRPRCCSPHPKQSRLQPVSLFRIAWRLSAERLLDSTSDTLRNSTDLWFYRTPVNYLNLTPRGGHLGDHPEVFGLVDQHSRLLRRPRSEQHSRANERRV